MVNKRRPAATRHVEINRKKKEKRNTRAQIFKEKQAVYAHYEFG